MTTPHGNLPRRTMSDTTKHSTNRSTDSAESFCKQTSVTCTHGEMRCIHCGIWNEYPIDASTKRGPMLMTVGDTLERAGFMKRPEPLTDEALWEMWVEMRSDVLRFARAIERAHGIGGEE